MARQPSPILGRSRKMSIMRAASRRHQGVREVRVSVPTNVIVRLTGLALLLAVLSGCAGSSKRYVAETAEPTVSLDKVCKTIVLGQPFSVTSVDSVVDSMEFHAMAGSMLPTYVVVSGGIELLVVTERYGSRVTQIQTFDPRAVTPDGVQVGSRMTEALALSDQPLRTEPGWAYWAALPSGWNAGGPPSIYPYGLSVEDMRVHSLFRRL